jgi:short-subunit dehydrogenase
MEGLAPVLRTFGIDVSVLEPGPVRTAFLRNAGGRTGHVLADDPYGALLGAYNTTMAGLLDAGESVTDVAELIVQIARADRPHFRYQSSPNATAIAARKVVDPTGDAVVAATSAFMLRGLNRPAVER